jgi:hypothetical protein
MSTPTSDVTVSETEAELIARARESLSECHWTVGECAGKWTTKYAKGRTDADFGALVFLSGDQIYQRRRVWETFGDVRSNYTGLRWSHFYCALNWDDSSECLQWAFENEATVAEMRAWRRLQRGEDLTTEAESSLDEWAGEGAVSFVPSEATAVRDPSEFGSEGGGKGAPGGARTPAETVGGVARESEAGVPFEGGSAGEQQGGRVAVAEKPKTSADQAVKRMTVAVERVNKSLTSELVKEFDKLPKKVRLRFIKAVGELSSKTANLM